MLVRERGRERGKIGLIIWCFVLAGKGTGRFGEERSWMKRRDK